MSVAPAAERAYESVKNGILDGSLRGGDLLSEADIGAPLGISRTPVHEAFLRLQAEGLLNLLPRRGAVVVPVEPGEATDVLEVRRALETAAVRRLAGEGPAAQRAREALDRALSPLLAAQRELAAGGDGVEFADADERFHRAIVEASGNAISLRFYATLADRQRRMSLTSLGSRADHLATLAEEHEQLARLARAGDVDGFDTALERHLSATHAALLGGAR